MVEYTCDKCQRTFNKIYDLRRHQKITSDCSKSQHANQSAKPNHTCDKCNKSFSRSDVLNRHRKKCDLSKKKRINIINFEKCKVNFTDKEASIILNRGSEAGIIESMIKSSYLNKKKKKYHNLYYPDHKSNKCLIYSNNEWCLANIDTVIAYLIKRLVHAVDNILSNNTDILNEEMITRLKKMKSNIEDPKSYLKIMTTYKSGIKKMFFNDRRIIRETKNI